MNKKFKIYTDGSCSLNNIHDTEKNYKGGCAFIVLDENDNEIYEMYYCYTNTTNNRMEIIAFHKAIKWMMENAPNCDYVIYSDSNNIVKCFTDKWYKKWLVNGWKTANRTPIKNIDLWKPLIHDYNKLKVSVEIEKVTAHTNNKWNNRADELANIWRNSENEDFNCDQESSN